MVFDVYINKDKAQVELVLIYPTFGPRLLSIELSSGLCNLATLSGSVGSILLPKNHQHRIKSNDKSARGKTS